LIQSEIPIKDVSFTKGNFSGLTPDGRAGVYDMICTDENGSTFIVEMQTSLFKYFLQRMKFYAFQRFNTMVKQGRYQFDDLTKIYCIGILEHKISDFPDYYNIGMLKNQNGLIMDDQIIYITVELDKFNLSVQSVKSDLEKLIFTMKNFDEYTETIQYPQFWTEEWLQVAINELDTRRFTPEQMMHYEMTLAKNAYAIQSEKVAISDAVLESKKVSIIKLLKANKLSIDEIADVIMVDIEFILKIKAELSTPS
jgi:predicted transposase/invertase (TIGR01784 family)